MRGRAKLAPVAECDAYLECATSAADAYALAAYAICSATGTDAWSNCVRSCLLAKYRCNQSALKNITDHAACFTACLARGLPRPPRLPSPGDIPRPSFLTLARQWTPGPW